MVKNLPELMAQLELFQPASIRKWIVSGFAWALNAFNRSVLFTCPLSPCHSEGHGFMAGLALAWEGGEGQKMLKVMGTLAEGWLL